MESQFGKDQKFNFSHYKFEIKYNINYFLNQMETS